MKIGKLAKMTNCAIQTIRFYEKESLISSKARSEGNYRIYDQTAVERLLFIKHCRQLDLSLSDIKQLLQLKDSPRANCDDVNQMIARHLDKVHQRIAELDALRLQLETLQTACSTGRAVEQCGILKNLAT